MLYCSVLEIGIEDVNLQVVNESDISFNDNLSDSLDSDSNETIEDQNRISVESKCPRAENKIKRNSGESYVTMKGEVVPARSVKHLKDCKRKCHLHISYTSQQQVFKEYWSLGTYEKRVNFITSMISVHEKKRTRNKNKTKLRKLSVTYYLNEDLCKTVVCKKCFLDTLDETEAFEKNIVNKMWNEVIMMPSLDRRGKKSPLNKSSSEKIKEIENHIQQFPAYESHYTRSHTSKKYLPVGLNVALMHRLSVQQTENPLSLKMYRQVFSKTGLQFKSPQLDTCHKYDEYKAKIKFADTDALKDELQIEREKHHELAELAYKAKKQDKKFASNSNGSCVFYTFDLQQCLPCPLLETSVAFYKRPLWVFNLTVSSSAGNTKCFMWHEAIAKRGGNEIASCLYQHLLHLSPSIKHVIFYSDCCSGQNKNKIVAGMLSAFQGSCLETIDHKFLVPGHTHMECDSEHAAIERAKKRFDIEIHHPQDWYNVVRQAKNDKPFEVIEMTQSEFYNFEKLFSDVFTMRKQNDDKNRFYWRDVRWLRYRKEEQGIIYYKTTFLEEDPFLKLTIKKKQ